jgi:hypothetical protein
LTFTSLSIKPLFSPEPDDIEKILLLIDAKDIGSFEVETQQTSLGLKLLNKLLEDIDAIQAQ